MGFLSNKTSRESLPGATSSSFFGISGLPDQSVPPVPSKGSQSRRESVSPGTKGGQRTPPRRAAPAASSSSNNNQAIASRLPPGLGSSVDAPHVLHGPTHGPPRNPAEYQQQQPAMLVKQRPTAAEQAAAAASPFMSKAQYQRIEDWVKHDAVPAAASPGSVPIDSTSPPLPVPPVEPTTGPMNGFPRAHASTTHREPPRVDPAAAALARMQIGDDESFDFRATLSGYRRPESPSRPGLGPVMPGPATPPKQTISRPSRRESLQTATASPGGYLDYYAGMPNGTPPPARGGPSARQFDQRDFRSTSPVKTAQQPGTPIRSPGTPYELSPQAGPRPNALAFFNGSPATATNTGPIRGQLQDPVSREPSPLPPIPGAYVAPESPARSNGRDEDSRGKHLPAAFAASHQNGAPNGRASPLSPIRTDLGPTQHMRHTARQPSSPEGFSPSQPMQPAPMNRLEPGPPERIAAILAGTEGGPKFEHALYAFPQTIFVSVISHLRWPDLRALRQVSKTMKHLLDFEARELVLQRYLGPYGYRTMPTLRAVLPLSFSEQAMANPMLHLGIDPRLTRRALVQTHVERQEEHIILELQDLDAFYAGRKYAVRDYSRRAQEHSRQGLSIEVLRIVRAATRAWNRIVLRLRAQAILVGSKDLIRSPYYFRHIPIAPSPIYKPGRAPVLRVWVPTKKSWMEDNEVVECEREIWRSGVWNLVRKGDVVHNVAIGDFGNEGRLISDGKYLRDLQYSYDVVGHLPPWLDMLSLSPGYFHNILASSTPNPVIYVNVTPLHDQIRETMQLASETAQVASAQGSYSVKRFAYHASVQIKPRLVIARTPSGYELAQEDWVGTVLIETEGTNEAAQALVDRAKARIPTPWRIIRERSRPGHLVMRPVHPHEKIN